MNLNLITHAPRLTAKYNRVVSKPITKTNRSLRKDATVAGVSFPCLFFRLVQVLYFAVLGLMPCPLGIFYVFLGPSPLTAYITYTANGRKIAVAFGVLEMDVQKVPRLLSPPRP